jgi:hypothetical protein
LSIAVRRQHCGTITASHTHDHATIQQAKSILVSLLDQSLPKVSLEFFLKYEAEDAPIRWDLHDCGKNRDTKDNSHRPVACVEADFDVNNQAVSVIVSIGTSQTGQAGVPVLFSATITDFAGTNHSVRHLGELPMMLHRPLRQPPRDLPDSGTSTGTI